MIPKDGECDSEMVSSSLGYSFCTFVVAHQFKVPCQCILFDRVRKDAKDAQGLEGHNLDRPVRLHNQRSHAPSRCVDFAAPINVK